MNPNYPLVAERATHRCEYCHAPEVIFNVPFEVDHILPVSKGGTDDPTNLALACRACNLWKSDVVTTQDIPLFNPRTQNWYVHFELQSLYFPLSGFAFFRNCASQRIFDLCQQNLSLFLTTLSKIGVLFDIIYHKQRYAHFHVYVKTT